MEENILDANSFETNDLSIDNQAQDYFFKMTFWSNFLGIISLIFGGLTVLGAFFVKKIFGALGAFGSDAFGSSYGIIITLIYIFIGFLLLFPGFKLVLFASKMKTALNTKNKVFLNDSINNLLAVFRFYGIITMVILIIYALTFILTLGTLFAL